MPTTGPNPRRNRKVAKKRKRISLREDPALSIQCLIQKVKANQLRYQIFDFEIITQNPFHHQHLEAFPPLP